MNYPMHTVRLAALMALISISARADTPAPGYVDFGKFSPPGRGGEFVEIDLKSNLVAMVASFAKKGQPEVAELLKGLHSARINVIGLTEENRVEMEQKIKDIRSHLDTHGWTRVVTVQEKGEDVGIYIKTRGEEAVEGVVVTVLDGKHEAVFINVVGDIRPEQLAVIGERLNLDPLKKVGNKLKKPQAN